MRYRFGQRGLRGAGRPLAAAGRGLLAFALLILLPAAVGAQTWRGETPPELLDPGRDPVSLPPFKQLEALRGGFGDWRPEWDPDSSGYDALHVRLEVEPIFADSTIQGTVEWTLAVLEDGLDAISFDLFDTLTVITTRIDGSAVLHTHAEDRLRLLLPLPAQPGDTLTAAIAYEGRPIRGFLQGFVFDVHDEDIPVAFTNSEPIASRAWWPCKDRPDDKFTAEMSYIVPDSMIATSSGLLQSVTPLARDRLRYDWVESYPLATYLVSMTATNFVSFHDTYEALDGTPMPLDYYAYPEDLPRAQSDWAFTPQAIRVLAETFGEYPFLDEKYGMVEYPWIGAMEHQTLSSMGEYFFQLDHPSDWVVVHELAHQWWGNWVTCGTWRDIWLNEGFATYCEALWAEELAGLDSLRYQMERFRRDAYAGSVYDPEFIFNSTVYRKGAWVLHMLRHVMGDEAFFAGLRAYGERHAYGNAVTSDLIAVMEEFYGAPLGWFFDPWVYGEGQPRYRVYWDPVAADATGRTSIEIRIEQESTGPQYFTMPIDVRFSLRGGEVFETVLWDSLPEQVFWVETPDLPQRLDIDPEGWILGRVLYVADPMDLPEECDPRTTLTLRLDAPRPNPFSGGTTIPLRLPPHLSGGRGGLRGDDTEGWGLRIFDPAGRTVRRLPLQSGPRGARFEWDGLDGHGRAVPPGVYWARLAMREAGTVRLLRIR
ncbi:MAG: hypothetical protein GF330_00790 [Candidatus Eisenbacteria bacterium]|nr:hypothetical protein [Candidatus Eisenbacteria bacterium]